MTEELLLDAEKKKVEDYCRRSPQEVAQTLAQVLEGRCPYCGEPCLGTAEPCSHKGQNQKKKKKRR